MSSDPSLMSPASTSRWNYYNLQYTPTVIFNGTDVTVGASSSEQYIDKVRNASLVPSPIRIDVDSFNPATGAVSATVTMFSTTYQLSGDDFHLILIEDAVSGTDTHVTRALFSDSITLSGVGNTAMFNTTFTIDPSWTQANLRVVAVVQKSDREIIQAGSSDPRPDFTVRAMVPFERTTFGAPTGTYETDPLTIMNAGLADTYEISVVIDEAPPGWSVAFRDSGGTVHTAPLSFGLSGDESTTFTAIVTPGQAGSIRYHLNVTSTNLTRPLEVPFIYITTNIDAMLIDDDGGQPYDAYFTEALTGAGVSYGLWDRGLAPLTAEIAQYCDLLIWNVGWSFPSLDADDKVFLESYLADGNSLFLSGQDIGWEMNDPGGNPDPTWYQTYLHARYLGDDTNIFDLVGVPGDPITDGLDLYINGGTGASNQLYPDEIEPFDADATAILNYVGDGCGAIRATDSVSGAKVVYLGFGFEGIDNADDRRDLLVPSVYWLLDIVFRDGFESMDTTAWSSWAP